jgi:hypothetical protein
MRAVKSVSVFACAVGMSFGVLGIPAASAITWNFNSNTGLLGTSQNYTVSGFTVTAAGFTNNTFATPTNLFGKNNAGDEKGVGLNNNGDHEISGSNLIRVALPAGLTSLSFQMNSTTDDEGWQVWASNLATSGYALLLAGNDESSHSISSLFSFLYFKATGQEGSNVLLTSISATPTPLPPAVLLFGTVLAGLGFLQRRRKKQYGPHAA